MTLKAVSNPGLANPVSVAQGGFGLVNGYKRVQKLAQQALSYNTAYPALFAYAPTVTWATATAMSSYVTVPFNGQKLQLATNASSNAGTNTLSFASTALLSVGMQVGSISNVQQSTFSQKYPPGTVITALTSTTATLNNNALYTDGGGLPVYFGPQVVSFPNILPVTQNFYNGYWITDGASGYSLTNTAGVHHDYTMVEFDYAGTNFDLIFRCLTASPLFWIWIDGQPVTADEVAPTGITPTVGESNVIMHVNFNNAGDNTNRWRRIRLVLDAANFQGLNINATDTVAPVTDVHLSVGTLGDSYIEGVTGGTYPATLSDNILYKLGGFLNTPAIFNFAEGGTGYCSNGGGANGKSAYTDPVRMNAAIQCAPDVLLLFGSINDGNNAYTPAQVTAAANTVLSTLVPALPSTTFLMCGVQAYGTNTAANIANNNALKAVAAAFNIPFLSPIDEQWIDGSGNAGSTTGVGNADKMIAGDGVHPTGVGAELYARRLVKFIKNNV